MFMQEKVFLQNDNYPAQIMAHNKEVHSDNFGHFHFSVATSEENLEIIALMKRNPIHMEMDYIMDRRDDFFKVQKLMPGSKVLVARNTNTHELAGCLSLIKLEGMMAGEKVEYQYVTDLVRDKQEHSGLLMKKLLNYTFENHFDTDFIFGLINAENKRARMFSTSEILHYPGTVSAKFLYYEMVPLSSWRIPGKLTFRSPENQEELKSALDFINSYYQNHLLYRPLTLPFMTKMFAELPDFSLQNIVMLFSGGTLTGAMILYNPSKVVSLILAKMDRRSKLLLGIIRIIHRFTGFLFSPPAEREHIKTLQIRHLAGNKAAKNALLRYANNLAYRTRLHSVSMMLDQRDRIQPENLVCYEYQSLMFAAYKPAFKTKAELLGEKPVFFDITFS
jgi:hypothetical protein